MANKIQAKPKKIKTPMGIRKRIPQKQSIPDFFKKVHVIYGDIKLNSEVVQQYAGQYVIVNKRVLGKIFPYDEKHYELKSLSNHDTHYLPYKTLTSLLVPANEQEKSELLLDLYMNNPV